MNYGVEGLSSCEDWSQYFYFLRQSPSWDVVLIDLVPMTCICKMFPMFEPCCIPWWIRFGGTRDFLRTAIIPASRIS